MQFARGTAIILTTIIAPNEHLGSSLSASRERAAAQCVSKIGCKAAASATTLQNVVLNVCNVTFTAQLLSTNTVETRHRFFFHPMYLTSPLKGSLVIGYRRVWGQKGRIIALPVLERSLTISSAVWIQYMNVTD